MAERRDVPRGTLAGEANPLVLALAEIAIAVVERRREADERRRTIRLVKDEHNGGRAA